MENIGSKIQMADLIASFPNTNLPHIQNLLSAKREFRERKSSPTEPRPKIRGELYRHQQIIRIFLQHYDRLLMIHETGTGKTCSVIGFVEWAIRQKKLYLSSQGRSGKNFNRAYVFVRGSTLKEEIKKQIVCVCSDGHYETDAVKNAATETGQKANVTRELHKFFTFTTYTSFAHLIIKEYGQKFYENPEFIREYSDSIFWIDEGHYLRISPEELDPSTKKLSRESREKVKTYKLFWNAFHSLKRIKVIISSATPAVNSLKELTPLFNLLNGLDKQIPLNFNYDQATIEDIEYYARNIVSYIRALDTGIDIRYKGIRYPNPFTFEDITFMPELVFVPNQMSEAQRNALISFQSQGNTGKNLFEAERQISNFVFPDGKWGNGLTEEEKTTLRKKRKEKKEILQAEKAEIQAVEEKIVQVAEDETDYLAMLDQVLEEEEKEKETEEFTELNVATGKSAFRRYVQIPSNDKFEATPEFRAQISTLEKMAQWSPIYANICRSVLESKGVVFIPDDLVTGSGLIVLALCLESIGLIRYDENSSIFETVGGSLKPYCAQQSTNTQVRSDFQARPRYALLTGLTSAAKFNSMMEVLTSKENLHGEYIKVFLSGPVGHVGINVNNVTEIHLPSGKWTQGDIYQTISRAIRTNSHIDLVEEQKQIAIAEGRDPNTIRIPVDIYQHCAVDPNLFSIDLYMYLTAEGKDRKNRRILRYLKQISFDCPFHRERNIRPGDVDGSRTCDYQQCDYSCFDPVAEYVDESTFDVYYQQGLLDELKDRISKFFRTTSTATLPVLTQALQISEKYIIMALSQIIRDKMVIYDRFGYQNYLVEQGDYYFLTRFYPTEVKWADAYYSKNLIVLDSRPITELTLGREVEKDSQLIAFLNQPMNEEKFKEVINTTNLDTRARILERAIDQTLSGNPDNFSRQVTEYMKTMFYAIHEPVTEIKKRELHYSTSDTRSGRKELEESYKKIKRLTPEELANFVHDTNTEMVYVHRVYTLEQATTAHSLTSQVEKAEGRLRLLKPSEGKWRDMGRFELPVYNAIIQASIKSMVSTFEEKPVYAKIINNQFKIVNTRLQRPDTTSNRDKYTGTNCKTAYRPELFLAAFHFGVPLPPALRNINYPPIEDIKYDVQIATSARWNKNDIYQRLTNDEYAYIWSWLQLENINNPQIKKKYTVSKLCNMLFEYAKSNNLILQLSD